jgi:serine protease Do
MRVRSWIGILALLTFVLVPVGTTSAQKARDGSLEGLSQSFESLVKRIAPAVVAVYATGYGPSGDGSTTDALITTRRAGGSGVIVHPDGYIVTNAHVVEGARKVQVLLPVSDPEMKNARSTLKPRGKRVGAQIVGVDRETDLAVLRVTGKELPHLELSDSDELGQGQIVLAFGSPFGLDNSVSMGVVSALARQLTPESPMIYIQTDATINPGNSGGPLVDTQGRVVGINTMIATHAGGSEGVGFAAPSNIVRNVYNQLRSSGRVRRGHIGIHAQTITTIIAIGLGLDREWGVVIADVYPDGPADKAGLLIGDIVLTLNGKPMENGRQFEVNLYRYAVGEEVAVEISRGGSLSTVSVPVIERHDDPKRFSDLVRPDRNLIPKLGILGIDVDDYTARMIPTLREKSGVIVAARAADAPFRDDTLMPGDVIHRVNQLPIRNVEDLRNVLRMLISGDAAVCHVERGGRMVYVALEIEI